ncbi:MAG: HEAT repeat domain-containing protein [Flavobacteriales bacterium]
MSDKKKPALKQLITDLQSNDDAIILNALENSRSIGTTEVTPLLIQLLLNENEEVQLTAERILHSLKDSASAAVIIQSLDNPELKAVYPKLIATFWMAGLDATPYLTRLVKQAITGSFLECIEVFSVIENIEPEDLPHDQEMESLLLLNAYFENNKKEEKTELLKDIARMLQQS